MKRKPKEPSFKILKETQLANGMWELKIKYNKEARRMLQEMSEITGKTSSELIEEAIYEFVTLGEGE